MLKIDPKSLGAFEKRTPGPRYSGFLRSLHAYYGIVARFMTMWKKQILARAIRILKENWGNRAFFRDIWKENAIHSLYFEAFFTIMVA